MYATDFMIIIGTIKFDGPKIILQTFLKCHFSVLARKQSQFINIAEKEFMISRIPVILFDGFGMTCGLT